MQSPETANQQCTMCGKPSSQWCKQCRSSSYCSRECQKADWPVHKILCSTFLNFSTPPNNSSHRGIFFPVDEKTPKFVWVQYKWETMDGDSYQHVDKTPFLGDSMADRVWVQRNNVRSRAREDVVTVYLRESGLKDGSKINQCVIAVARGRYINFCWPGPLLVLRSEGLTLGDSCLADMDMVDFRDAVDVLCSYPDVNINVADPESVRMSVGPAGGVWGVRINCQGEQEVYKREKFEAVKVPRSDPVFGVPVTSISKLISLPIKVIRCSTYKSMEGYNSTNPEATFLHMNANPRDESWGWAPMEWQDPAGNVVVVREDGKPLLPQHAQALCHFCLSYLQPLFDDSLEQGSARARAKVMEKITRTEFEGFYLGYDRFKRESDSSWKSVEHPLSI